MSISLNGGAAGIIDVPAKLGAAHTSGDWVGLILDGSPDCYNFSTPDLSAIGELFGIFGVIVSGTQGVSTFASGDEVMVRVQGPARAKVDGTTDIAIGDPLVIANSTAYAVKATVTVPAGTGALVNSDAVGALTAALGSKTSSADAATQGAGYVQADVQSIATLANELKTDFNNLYDDVNHATTGLRVAIAAARTLANDIKEKLNLLKTVKGVALEAYATNSTAYKNVWVKGI